MVKTAQRADVEQSDRSGNERGSSTVGFLLLSDLPNDAAGLAGVGIATAVAAVGCLVYELLGGFVVGLLRCAVARSSSAGLWETVSSNSWDMFESGLVSWLVS